MSLVLQFARLSQNVTRKEASMYLMYYESLWNHVVVKQEVFNRLKIT